MHAGDARGTAGASQRCCACAHGLAGVKPKQGEQALAARGAKSGHQRACAAAGNDTKREGGKRHGKAREKGRTSARGRDELGDAWEKGDGSVQRSICERRDERLGTHDCL